MRNFLPAALAFAVMLAPLSPVMAEDLGVGVGPVGVGVHVGDQDHGDRQNGDRDRVIEHRSVGDHDRDHNRGCRMVITKDHHHGMTTTKRERKCD